MEIEFFRCSEREGCDEENEWLVSYVATQLKNNSDGENPYVTQIREGMVSDLLEMKPDLIMINVSPKQRYVPGGYFDYLKFWSKDPRFEQIWKDYVFRTREGDFAVYTLIPSSH